MEKTHKKSKFFEEFIQPNLPKTKKEYFWFILIILIVVTIGLFAVNQYLSIKYKATLIQSPCNLCKTFRRNPYGIQVNDNNFSNITIINKEFKITPIK